jgi:ketosteroid isomerase-like protein
MSGLFLKKFNKMKSLLQIGCIFVMFSACTALQGENTDENAQPDLAQIRTDIETLENNWAIAVNTKNIPELMAFYADDAVSMPDDSPMLVGKEAIRKFQEKQNLSQKLTHSFETIEVFSEGKQVLEVGKTTMKDSTGKVVGSGKYMALFEKRGREYLCIREMYNDDAK